MGLALGAIGGLGAAGANSQGFLRSDILGDIASVTQFIDPIISPAYLAMQEGQTQEQAAKNEARAIEGQARIDAEQARRAALYANGQDYLFFTRSGVFSGVGSPLDLITQNALEREKEALAIELKGWNEGKRLRIEGHNVALAAKIAGLKATTDPAKTVLAQFGMGQSPLGGRGGAATGNAFSGYAAAEGGISYAGATAAGIDAAAGGAAATAGAGSSLLSAAVIV